MGSERARRMADAAADLLLGATCPGCAQPGRGLCADCREALDEPLRLVQRSCLDVPVIAAGEYRGVRRAALTSFKERGVWTLAGTFAAPLSRAALQICVAQGWWRPVLVVPAPSSARTVRERGQDTTALLAGPVARTLRGAGLRARAAPVLRQRSGGRDQAGLSADDRLLNLTGRHRVRGDVQGWGVVLVDDIVTTGATLSEACRALGAAGAIVIGAVTSAETVRWQTGSGVARRPLQEGPDVPAEGLHQARPPR